MKLTGKLGSQANSRSAVDLRIPAGMVRVITLNPPPGPFIWHKVSYFVFSAVLHFFFVFLPTSTTDLLGCVESTGPSQPGED